ncbi:hypothetical protein ACN4EE_11445 [Geminocystis sp. CENA526]
MDDRESSLGKLALNALSYLGFRRCPEEYLPQQYFNSIPMVLLDNVNLIFFVALLGVMDLITLDS